MKGKSGVKDSKYVAVINP